MELDDYDKGLAEVLRNLTVTPPFEKVSFKNYILKMESSRNKYINIVGFEKGRAIAFGTVVLAVTLRGVTGYI